MKIKYLILTILFVSVLLPCQLFAQSTDVFKQEGIASWYGREFEGRPTASGEIFDSSLLTAAHPSLPFGTRLVVTNQHNNKSVTVRVNDRGPFVPARIIDISRAAAERLDMIVTGTAPVSIVSIDRISASNLAVGTQVTAPAAVAPVAPVPTVAAPVPAANMPTHIVYMPPVLTAPTTVVYAPPAASSPSPVVYVQPVAAAPVFEDRRAPGSQVKLVPELNILPVKNYRLQVGSFKNAKNAVDAFDKLKAAGLTPNYERFVNEQNVEYYRVVLAGVPGADVQSTAERLNAAGFKEAIIREEN